MYKEFKEYLEGVKTAQMMLREDTLDFALYHNSIMLRKGGFLKLVVYFNGDTIKFQIEINESENSSKVRSISEYAKKSSDSECNMEFFRVCQFTIRFEDYDEFIKFFDKHILDMNV